MSTIDCLGTYSSADATVLRNMFHARKRIFFDLLRWDVPVLAGRYELDQFDGPDTTYLVLTDDDNEHQASARLLSTQRPHLMNTVFADLVPDGRSIEGSVMEISRLCLSRDLTSLVPLR